MKNISKGTSIHGLDIGNATCKSHLEVLFDSKITTAEPFGKAPKVIIDGETYWLGEGSYDTTYRKVSKRNYINMLFGLLALNTETTHNFIGLGLPLGQYVEDKGELINLVLSNSSKIVKLNEEEEMPIIIDDLEVYPEGVSTLPDDFEGIVVDIGGLTTDCALVINDRDKRKIITPVSIPTGTINLYTDFINKLNSKYSLDLKITDAERTLANGLYLDGIKVDIDFALNMYKDYSENLISQLQVDYSLRTNMISLTGGGAYMLYDQLKSRIGKGLRLQTNAIFANAKAYYELGCSDFE